jgi:hypothetical protein
MPRAARCNCRYGARWLSRALTGHDDLDGAGSSQGGAAI